MQGESAQYRIYGYRWVVLAVAMAVNFPMQMLWISYAPITHEAATYYGVSALAIGLLSMAFMIAFIPLSLPAAWFIDKMGFRWAMGLGSVMMSIGGIARGLAGDDYTVVLLSTVLIACSQPLLLNSWTTVPAKWFPHRQRATAVSLITLASLLGTAAGMALTPVLTASMSIPSVQLVYGLLAAAGTGAFLLLARARPATPPCAPGEDERALMLDGLKHALTVKPFLVFLGMMFVGFGIFNGVTTWVERIVAPRGFTSTDAGTAGALMLIGGILGAVIIAGISDRQNKRIRFLVLALTLAIPGLLGLAFAQTALVLFASAFVLGFFLVSSSPVGMQFAAEVTYPTPEGTSNGLVQLVAQAAVVFVYAMDALKTSSGSFTPSLLLAVAMLIAAALAMSRLKDPAPIVRTAVTGPAEAAEAAP